MKSDVWYRPQDLGHLGIDPETVRTILKQLHKGNIIECEDDGYRKRKVYKTKQKDLFEAPSQAILDNSLYKK